MKHSPRRIPFVIGMPPVAIDKNFNVAGVVRGEEIQGQRMCWTGQDSEVEEYKQCSATRLEMWTHLFNPKPVAGHSICRRWRPSSVIGHHLGVYTAMWALSTSVLSTQGMSLRFTLEYNST